MERAGQTPHGARPNRKEAWFGAQASARRVPARRAKPSGRSLEPRSNARPRGMAVLPEQSGGQNSAYRSGCFLKPSLVVRRWSLARPFTHEGCEFLSHNSDLWIYSTPLALPGFGQRPTTNAQRRNSIRTLEKTMSAPSRRPEIRRRRTRKEKIVKLLKRHAAAGTEADRSRLAGKLARLARTSPGQPLVKS